MTGGARYGNLMSYKHYARPAAYGLCGSGAAKRRTRHQDGMREMLRAMFGHGECTTWNMAKISLRTGDASLVRAKEKEYRRLLLGRRDAKRRPGGMLDSGLVVRSGGGAPSRYRLSLHGIMYCIDAMDPDDAEIDGMARAHAGALPRVFGRWGELVSALGGGAYTPLRVMSKGLLLDNPRTAGEGGGAPLYELMSFLHAEYGGSYESIREPELAEQVSYWFYTFLLYPGAAGGAGLGGALGGDGELRGWYAGFLRRARGYYEERLRAMRRGLPAAGLRATSSAS